MEQYSQILFDSAFGKFVSYYESFVNEMLDPYRREKKGHFEDKALLSHLEAAFTKVVSIINPLYKPRGVTVNDYRYLNRPEEVSKALLGYTNRSIETYFLDEPDLAYVPDLTALSTEVTFNLREFAKQTLPGTIIKETAPRHLFTQL